MRDLERELAAWVAPEHSIIQSSNLYYLSTIAVLSSHIPMRRGRGGGGGGTRSPNELIPSPSLSTGYNLPPPTTTSHNHHHHHQSHPLPKMPANSSSHCRSTSSNPSTTAQSTSMIATTLLSTAPLCSTSTVTGTTISLLLSPSQAM